MGGLELGETHSSPQSEERILVDDDLALLDSPGSEESSPLPRRLPDDEGRTGRFVNLPVILLTLLRTIGNFPTDTAQLGILLAEVARPHLLLY